MQKIEYILKHNRIIQKIYVVFMSIFFRIIGLFVKTDKKLVLFSSLIGKNFGDSPKVLFEAMKADSFFADYKFVWAFDEPENFVVDGAKKVKLNSINYFITALQAGVWITNVNIERGLHFKPKGTIYLNTWHGCAPLKIDGNAQKNRNDYDFSNVDILCSNSTWQDSLFIRDYKATRENILRCGLPRNDTLYNVNEQTICEIRKKYAIPDGKKIILYAPTWREQTTKNGMHNLDIPINIGEWKRILGNDYVILFRMHHLAKNKLNIEYDSIVRDYSGQYDINELMIMADILITDYSSTLTDYSILEKPVLFFAYDYDEYLKERGLYTRLEELLPECVCRTESELLKKITDLDYDTESEKVKKLKESYVCLNNKSTQKCIDELKKCIRMREI